MNSLAILGASGHGKVLADIAELNGWQKIVFFDDAWPKVMLNGHWPVIGNTADLITQLHGFDGVIVGIGNNKIRLEKQALLKTKGGQLVSLVHPSAQVSRYVEIGIGTVVMPGVCINVDTKIGEACIINTNASIDHDCVLEDGVHLSPNTALAGGVKVAEAAWLGMNSSVRQLIEVGKGAIVGMGAVVTKNVPAGVTVIGNPARLLVRQ